MDSEKRKRFIKEIDSDNWSDELKELFVNAICEETDKILKLMHEEEMNEKKQIKTTAFKTKAVVFILTKLNKRLYKSVRIC